MWVMWEWAVGQWIVGVTSFQKIYGLYGLNHHTVEISGGVTEAGRTDERKGKLELLTSDQEAVESHNNF